MKYWYINWSAEYIEGNNTFSLFRNKQLVFTGFENQLLILASGFRILEEGMGVFSYFVEPEGEVLNPGKLFACKLDKGRYFWKKCSSWWEWEGTTHVLQSITCSTACSDISFNVLFYKGGKSGVLFGCTFKNKVRFWELANLNHT